MARRSFAEWFILILAGIGWVIANVVLFFRWLFSWFGR